MKQLGTIFRFEFKNYAKRKSFIILTLILVIMVGVALSVPRIKTALATTGASPESKPLIAVMDKSGADSKETAEYFSSALKDKDFVSVNNSTDMLKTDVESGKYDSAIIINSALEYTRIVKNIGMNDYADTQIDEVMLAKYRSSALAKLGVSSGDAQKILSAQVKSDVVKTASGKDQIKNFFYTYILIFALYMAILLYGQFVATSVATEKSTRAMELLITSTKPKYLMFGKVFGAGTAGLLQLALIFGSGYVFYNLNGSYYEDNATVQSIFNMPLSILLYALLFFVLGFFIYAFIYGALASTVSRMEELSTTIAPVTYIFIIAFMIVMFSMGNGSVDNTAMTVCSYIPFTSPMAMFARIAMGNVANWEIIVSVVILIASTVGMGFLASAIYRMGVLMYGKAPKPREILKMLKSSKS